MRTIMNISLPEPMMALVNQAISSGKYATKSEFIRVLLRDYQEKQTARELKESQREMFLRGGTVLGSLKDLR